ncbi:MAG: glycosyltransferase [Deltaproteobacteria bacterium]|nr:glycosyltransferase [Deltaproteobacteria bacterium]
MNIPRISIGIVTYNRVEFLRRAISSALIQGDAVSEIIVVNDGSTDGTKAYIDNLSIPQIVAVHLWENSGRPQARNEVVARMKGDYLLWLDDDDALAENCLSSHLEILAKHPDADIIYGNHVACDADLNPKEERKSRDARQGEMLMQLVYEDIIPNGGTLIRKSVFSRVGNYDLSFKRAQDYDFWVRAAIAGCKFVHNDSPIYYFRFHENNLANPHLICDQSEYHCKILAKTIENALIEEIFPVLNWNEQPKESAAKALLLLARIFFDHGDDNKALDCIQLSEQYCSSREASAMKAYVYRALAKYSESAQTFGALLGEMYPEFSAMLVEVGAPRGSAAVARGFSSRVAG